jgi:hypothetical protein
MLDTGASLMICKTRLSITETGLPVRSSESNELSSSMRLLNDGGTDHLSKAPSYWLILGTNFEDRLKIGTLHLHWAFV